MKDYLFISDVKIGFLQLSANRANPINPVTDQRKSPE